MEKTVDKAMECAYTKKAFNKNRKKGGSKAMMKLRTYKTPTKQSVNASRDIAG